MRGIPPACTLVASAGADRLVRIWNLATGEEVRHFGEFGNRVDGIAFSPDGTRIATACLDRSVRIWDVETGTEVASFPGHTAPVFSVTFSPDGKKLASASQDATVKIWDLTNLPGVRMLHLPEHGSRSSLPGISWTGGVAFRPGSGELAAAGSDQTLAVWRPHSRTARLEIAPGSGAATSVQYRAEGQLLATAGADRRAAIRDAGRSPRRCSFITTRRGWSAWPSIRRNRSWPREVVIRLRCCTSHGERKFARSGDPIDPALGSENGHDSARAFRSPGIDPRTALRFRRKPSVLGRFGWIGEDLGPCHGPLASETLRAHGRPLRFGSET